MRAVDDRPIVPRPRGLRRRPEVLGAALAVLVASTGAAQSRSSLPEGRVGTKAPSHQRVSAPEEERPPVEAPAARVDLNTASIDELCTLPGIGKKRAEAIVDYRQRRRFSRPTQLLNIKGIGRKTLKRLRPLIQVRSIRSGKSAQPTSRIQKPSRSRPVAMPPTDSEPGPHRSGCPKSRLKHPA